MRWLRLSLAIITCAAYAQTALALDPLLVEFGWSQPNPVTLPANYVALIESNPWNGVSDPAVTAYPTTTFADPSSLVFFNQNCADGSTCGVGFANGGQQPGPVAQFSLDQVLGGPNRLWADGWDGDSQPFTGHSGTWHAATYVPQLGGPNQALFGYKITAIEREITSSTQAIRLYGTLVPEPATWVLALLVACIWHLSRGRKEKGDGEDGKRVRTQNYFSAAAATCGSSGSQRDLIFIRHCALAGDRDSRKRPDPSSRPVRY